MESDDTVRAHVDLSTGGADREMERVLASAARLPRPDAVGIRFVHGGRDHIARGHGWGAPSSQDVGTALAGLTLLLVSDGDAPADWLHTGQAMQRVLLRATERDLAAAFHTQALEVPELRAFISAHFCNGAHPQMLLRLGVPHGEELGTIRRPVKEVIEEV